jgi:hypothetical protein
MFGQDGVGKIEGTVVDAITKEPLPGVNILVLQTKIGETTNIDGKFEIENLEVGNYILRFSFIGYKTVVKTDVVVNSVRPANVHAKQGGRTEAVSTAGYKFLFNYAQYVLDRLL